MRWVPLLCVLHAWVALAIPTFVRESDHSDSTNTAVVTLTGASMVGNTLVVPITWDTSDAGATCSDNAGNVYLAATPPIQGGRILADNYIEVLYARIVDAGATPLAVTCTEPSSTAMEFSVLEYSGIDLVSPIDTWLGIVATTVDIDSGVLVTHSPDDLLVAWITTQGLLAENDAAFNIRSEVDFDLVEDRIAPTPGPYIVTDTSSGPDSTVLLVAFNATNDGGSTDAGSGGTPARKMRVHPTQELQAMRARCPTPVRQTAAPTTLGPRRTLASTAVRPATRVRLQTA